MPKVVALLLSLAALLAGGLATDPLAAQSPETDAVEPAAAGGDAALETSVETRARMGLETNLDHVRAVARSAVDVDPILQIPLIGEEASEVQRRQEVGSRFEALQQAATAEAPEFGGVYLDNRRGGIAVVLTTADTPRLRQVISASLPPDAKVEVRQAPNTWAALRAAQADLLERWQAGPEATGGARIVSERIRVSDNRIIVEVGSSGGVVEPAAALAKATGYGPELVQVVAGEPPEPAVSRYATSGSLYGGGRIKGPAGSTCTGTGAAYVNGVNYWLVTAGHCGGAAGNWHQGSSIGPSIGPETGHSNGFFDYASTYCDCMVIGPIYGKQTNQVLNSLNNPQNEWYMPTTALYYQGQQVCMSGASRNGVVCGEIVDPSASIQFTTNGHTPIQLDQVFATYDTCGGDSGGPVTVGTTWAGVNSARSTTSTYWITAGDGGAVPCGPNSYASKLTASNLYWYLGMDGMMTWQ